jgi:hypothetical protein
MYRYNSYRGIFQYESYNLSLFMYKQEEKRFYASTLTIVLYQHILSITDEVKFLFYVSNKGCFISFGPTVSFILFFAMFICKQILTVYSFEEQHLGYHPQVFEINLH